MPLFGCRFGVGSSRLTTIEFEVVIVDGLAGCVGIVCMYVSMGVFLYEL